MQDIKSHICSIYKLLKREKKIVFPDTTIINQWDIVLKQWVDDKDMLLFARKGGQTRGTKFQNSFGRLIMTTDNTPAHYIFKTLVFDKKNLTKKNIHNLLSTNKFPISFIRKKSEYETLIDGMVADSSVRLNEIGWKLAHIKRIALKRGSNLSQDDYHMHHLKFLSLDNMYLIDKAFSGLAEVPLFNEIVSEDKLKH
jgi:hypothetical protein